MTDFWAISMLISGGLFAGGAASIALERLPAWRATELSEFRVALLILIGLATLLVPVQRRLASSRAELLLPEAERLRDFWLRGHLIRTVAALGALVLAVVASVS
jgi:hypothetical protein